MDACEIEIGSHLYVEALELRYELFFRKHHLPKETLMDEHEETSKHFAIADGIALIAYGRLTDLGQGIYQLSRIVVEPQQQGKGYGAIILTELVKQANNDGCKKIILNARVTTTALYKNHGFRNNGDIFLSKTTEISGSRNLGVRSFHDIKQAQHRSDQQSDKSALGITPL